MTENMPEHVTQEFLDIIKLPNPGGKRLNYVIVVPCYIENYSVLSLILGTEPHPRIAGNFKVRKTRKSKAGNRTRDSLFFWFLPRLLKAKTF
ncbi:MAG: hypothetical protein LBJ36_10790 [Synergistaceae bacterium]|jgi:hypothetical protein|nr:hypothetical protein [Synergistaceae bacterium]